MFRFGKYREIVMAVAFFLVFDMAVLVLNFFISFQIAEDSVAINVAGRQRMLSQRMTKATFELQSLDPLDEAARGISLAELDTTVTLFDSSLSAFERGGTVIGGNGEPVRIKAVTSLETQAVLLQADPLWTRYRTALLGVIDSGGNKPEALASAAAVARSVNVELLGLMNQLTTRLESRALAQATRLRAVQTAGILLALMNFVFILYKFFRRLNDYDLRVERAQRETSEILGTVREGLLLVDPQFRIGEQMSKSTASLVGHHVEPGQDFRELLKALVPDELYGPSCDYITLLMGDRVRESLVQDLNPLTAVQVRSDGSGKPARYLTLAFNRSMEKGKLSHLLVTVLDVTRQQELELALVDARRQAQAEVSGMLGMLNLEPAELRRFLTTTERRLLEINDHLRSAGGTVDYRQVITAILRLMHSIKGDAAVLGLHIFENLAQQFEVQLIEMRNKGSVSGDDLLALPLPLDEFFRRLSTVTELLYRLHPTHAAPGAIPQNRPSVQLLDQLTSLAERIANEHGKQVRLRAELSAWDNLDDDRRDVLREVAVQLIRNAIAHGIETADVRTSLGKDPVGEITLRLDRKDGQPLNFSIHDDGQGICPARIRAALVRDGRMSQEEADALPDKALIRRIFEPGISTREDADVHAGHGIGLDLVATRIQAIGARLNLASRENVFTRFTVTLAA